MGGLSIWHWIIVGGVVFVLFGGKFKISDVMTDVAKGIKAFKKGMAEDETTASTPRRLLNRSRVCRGIMRPSTRRATPRSCKARCSPRPSRRLPATLARTDKCLISTPAS